MRSRRLPKVLRDIVALTLASTATYACSSDELGSDMESACTGGRNAAALSGFKPGVPVDFMVQRSESVIRSADGLSVEIKVTDGEQTGERCKTASDRAACEKALGDLHIVTADTCQESSQQTDPSARNRIGCDASFILFTRGDQVFALKNEEEIEAFLRPIDTKEEAFFVATANAHAEAVCGGSDEPKWKPASDGFDLLVFDWTNSCQSSGGHVDRVVVHVSSEGNANEVAREKARDEGPCSEGRRPRGLRSKGRARKPRSNLGAYFAKASHLEAASVVAFAQLERELAALGAPRRILRALAKARNDEVRHARVTEKLARRFGAVPPSVRVEKRSDRGALAIAIENAREGCVRETLGAVVALHRAERAADPEVARAMRSIAADELRHARLSWELMEWLNGRLSARGRAAVRRAFAREIAVLSTQLVDPAADVARIAGAPSASTLRALFDRIEAEVWRPVLAAA
jgi:hypothetical protein